MPRIPITDLGGSINQGRPPSEIGANEYASLANFYQFGSKLFRRGGTRMLVQSSPMADGIYGMVSYRPESPPLGGVDMIVAGSTELGIMVGGTIATIPRQLGFFIPASTRRWTLFQYKNIVYGIRDGIGLVRSDGSTVGPGGIAAPTVAPIIVDGAAGDIPAASFKAVYTFYNRNTGMESNPSPVSNTLAHAGGTKIDWSLIATSSNAQVTGRRIYRSLPDQSGEYFLVAEIDNNIDTTYVDNVLAEDLDDAVSLVNGVPPADMKMGTVWKERLFASDGTDVFHSEDGLIEAFDPQAVIPVFPDDGHEIRALHAYGDRLIIGKTNKIHYLVGSDPGNFALLTLSDRHGCVSHHSMQSAEGYLFWLGADNVYRSDGNSVIGIASVKLKSTLALISEAAARDSVATVLPQLGWYMLMIPGSSTGNIILVYNYRTDVWALFTTNNFETYSFIADYFDADYNQEIYAASESGHVFRLNDSSHGYDDALLFGVVQGNLISAQFTSRAFGAEASTKHVVEKASLLCARYAESITLAIVSEGATIKSRAVSLDYEPRWKLYNLSTRHQAKSQSQLRITYTGATQIELEGFALDIEPLGRPTMQAV